MEAERTRGRLESQVKESGAIEQRIAQARRNRRSSASRLDALDAGDRRPQEEPGRARSADRRSRASACIGDQPAARGLAGQSPRAREGHRSRPAGDPAPAGRSVHAEEPARADRRVPGRNRARDARAPRAKSRWPRPRSSGWRPRASSSPRPWRSARWSWKPSPASAGAPKRTWPSAASATPPNCAAKSTRVKTEVSPDPRAQGIAGAGAGAPHLHHRIGEAPVRVARKGQGAGSQAAGRAGRLRGSGSAVRKAGRRIPARRAGIRGGARTGQQAERGLDFIRAELDGRATFLVHPEPDARNGTATCRSRPSARRPASRRA